MKMWTQRMIAMMFIGLCANVTPGHAQSVLYVDDDAPAGGDGTTWSSALRYVQDAILIAGQRGSEVSEIRVARGVYRPDLGSNEWPGDREATFLLVDGVAVVGGFAGMNMPDPDERNVYAYRTVFSGDLLGDDAPGFVNIGDNSGHVVTAIETGESTVLDGVTISGGNTEDTEWEEGAGLRIIGGAPLVANVVFETNIASSGGGAYAEGGAPTFDGCIFRGNSASWGGGIRLEEETAAVLRDCLFVDNEGGQGSAAYTHHNCTPLFQACLFIGNVAEKGTLRSDSGVVTLDHCVFHDNHTERGGAVYELGDEVIATDCVFVDNTATNDGGVLHLFSAAFLAENCVFRGNQGGDGGALYIGSDDGSRFVNCSFTHNIATGAGGVGGAIFLLWGTPEFMNCILWGDSPDEVYEHDIFDVDITYSDIAGGHEGEGNIDEDPLFVRPGDGNLRLLPDSPCTDTGTNDAVSTPFDLDGNDRIIDGDDDGTATVDMGAFEYFHVDCNQNGVHDGIEIRLGTSEDCNANGRPDECDLDDGLSDDCNANGVPDECDLFNGSSSDCNENGVPDECDIFNGSSPDCNENGVPDECDVRSGASPDCNDNVIPDECDIESGFSEDCNENGVPDDCDIDGGASGDCNANGIPDECDIAGGFSEDCNENGIPDECDLDSGASPDCNENAIPDECDIESGASGDCNGNGIPDECDIADGTSADIDGNGVPDECQDCNENGVFDPDDIDNGTSEDCNNNTIPDECEVSAYVWAASDDLSPIGWGVPQSFILPAPPEALEDVALTFEAFADLSHGSEAIDVTINDVLVGRVFETGGHDCPGEPDAAQLTVSAGTFNEAIDGGLDAVITMTATESVDPALCGGHSYISVAVDYQAFHPADMNGNGIPDACECPADFDGDWIVGTSDLLHLLGAWGTPDGDVDFDGDTDTADLLALLAAWGACP